MIDDDAPHEVIHEAALDLPCSRCGSAPGQSCRTSRGRYMAGLHAERLAAAQGVRPAKENRPGSWRRMPWQGRVDPTVTVRRLDE